MSNVRLDQNGVPKGPCYDPELPALHRSGVTAVDSVDPADTSGAVNTGGYQNCRFDITITGVGFTSLDVQVLFWNSRQSKWFVGSSRRLDSVGQHAVITDCRGAIIYLKVAAFAGTSFNLSADYSLS